MHIRYMLIIVMALLISACTTTIQPEEDVEPVTQEDLVGTLWEWTALVETRPASQSLVADPGNYTLQFYADGSVDILADCNQVKGSYVVRRDTLLIEPGPSTRMACGPDSLDQQYLDLLIEVEAGNLITGGLRLVLADDAGHMAFRAVSLDGEGTSTPLPTVVLPTPEPQDPTGRVTAPNGVNIRSGPGTGYPVIGFALFNTTAELVGRGADGDWWATPLESSPTGFGWMADEFLEVTGAGSVPVLPSPPLPATSTPIPLTPSPVPPTPAPIIELSANPTDIQEGECSALNWRVENVQAVWLYPLGEPYQDHPEAGVGSRQECPAETTTYEMRVLLHNGQLELRQVTVNVSPAVEENPLANTSWVLSSFFVNQVPIPGTTLTLRFDADGNISGEGGCNTFNGIYTQQGASLILGSITATRALCSDEINQQEEFYFNTLRSVQSYSLEGGQLILRDGSGQEILRYNG